MSGGDLNVLVVEPYYGGSHKQFLDGLAQHLPFRFRPMTLPARKWKWRMRLAAPHFARLLHRLDERFDLVLCSTFLDVAAFRGLAPSQGLRPQAQGPRPFQAGVSSRACLKKS